MISLRYPTMILATTARTRPSILYGDANDRAHTTSRSFSSNRRVTALHDGGNAAKFKIRRNSWRPQDLTQVSRSQPLQMSRTRP